MSYKNTFKTAKIEKNINAGANPKLGILEELLKPSNKPALMDVASYLLKKNVLNIKNPSMKEGVLCANCLVEAGVYEEVAFSIDEKKLFSLNKTYAGKANRKKGYWRDAIISH
jgi:hypothetical protein